MKVLFTSYLWGNILAHATYVGPIIAILVLLVTVCLGVQL